MDNSCENKHKPVNGYKIATIVLSIIIILCSIFTFVQGVKISYNGISYNDGEAYINLFVENKALIGSEPLAYDNFSIKSNTTNAISPNIIAYYDETRWHQEFNYSIKAREKIRIKLIFYDANDIPNHGSLYYNGKKIADL